MLIVAAFAFFLAAVLGWVGGITIAHLIAIACLGFVFLALHLGFRPVGSPRRWYQ